MLFTLLLAADVPSIGRFDVQSLPHQTLIELLFEHFDDLKIAKDSDGNFIPIEEWSILKCDTSGLVKEIHALKNEHDMLIGSIDFQFVPPSVISLEIPRLWLKGSIETEQPPAGLRKLNCSRNRLNGTFNTRKLPQNLEYLSIHRNRFTGSLALDTLPYSLQHMDASNCNFTGEVNLCALPPSLEVLKIEENGFTGKIDMRSIPIKLRAVELHENDFDTQGIVVVDNHEFELFGVHDVFQDKIFTPSGEARSVTGFEFHCVYPEEDGTNYVCDDDYY